MEPAVSSPVALAGFFSCWPMCRCTGAPVRAAARPERCDLRRGERCPHGRTDDGAGAPGGDNIRPMNPLLRGPCAPSPGRSATVTRSAERRPHRRHFTSCPHVPDSDAGGFLYELFFGLRRDGHVRGSGRVRRLGIQQHVVPRRCGMDGCVHGGPSPDFADLCRQRTPGIGDRRRDRGRRRRERRDSLTVAGRLQPQRGRVEEYRNLRWVARRNRPAGSGRGAGP